jgi:hypothetical protein
MSPVPSRIPSRAGSIADVIAHMEEIEAASSSHDGVACFNRMYLEVTRLVDHRVGQGFFADPQFLIRLDVEFAGLYFQAVAAAGEPADVPLAWRPLIEQRANGQIEPIQFALAGMNAHINHDLPIAVVTTCAALGTEPSAGTHQEDYQKVDRLLDGAVGQVRESFESAPELAADRHLRAVANLIDSWSINSARDVAWTNALVLWSLRDEPTAQNLFTDALAGSVAAASTLLLTAI